MRMRKLGSSDIEVTEVCLGTMTWGHQNTEAEAHRQLDYARDRGVNFIDTAEMYPTPAQASTQGLTEAYIGTWLAGRRDRDSIVLATKISGGGAHRAWIRGGSRPSRQTISLAVEDSLRRLNTDHIDLYQVHWPWRSHYHFENAWTYDALVNDRDEVRDSILEQLEAFGELVAAGKLRAIGLSNETAWGLMHFSRLADRHGLPPIVSVQNEYSLLRRQFEFDLVEVSHQEQIGLLAYSPLAAGVLTGKYLDGALPAGSRGTLAGGVWRHNPRSEPTIRAYVELAARHGLDPAAMALAFCYSRPFMTSVIIGATSPEQLRADIDAAELQLDPAILAGIEAIHRRDPRPI